MANQSSIAYFPLALIGQIQMSLNKTHPSFQSVFETKIYTEIEPTPTPLTALSYHLIHGVCGYEINVGDIQMFLLFLTIRPILQMQIQQSRENYFIEAK